jgi:hypothetical protein
MPRPGGSCGVGDIAQRVEVGGACSAPSTQGATTLADLDLLLIAAFCTPTISCRGRRRTPGEARRMRRSSRCVWHRRCWRWRRIGGFSRSPRAGSAICSHGCRSGRGTTSAANGWPTSSRPDRRVRVPVPGLGRRPAGRRLGAGRMRPHRRDRPSQPQPLLLGLPPAWRVRARRHPTRLDLEIAKLRRTRRRDRAARPLPALRRGDHDRRQGLRQSRLRRHRDRAAGDPRQAPPQRGTGRGPQLAPIRQRIESIFWTCKDLLALERHGARTLHGLRVRLCQRFLALTAAIALNHRLGRPSRSLAPYSTSPRGRERSRGSNFGWVGRRGCVSSTRSLVARRCRRFAPTQAVRFAPITVDGATRVHFGTKSVRKGTRTARGPTVGAFCTPPTPASLNAEVRPSTPLAD